MNHDDKNDPAAATPQISPEPNPRLNKALTLVENKPQAAESPPFYSRRKQKRPPKIVTGGGADEARAYVSATTLPPNRDYQTTDMERVQVAAGLDPRQSQTLRSIRTDLTPGAPPPMPEGAFGGSTQPLYTQPKYTGQPGQAAPHALGEAPPEPQDGPPQSSRSRTIGGRTQRMLMAGAPEPAGEISASHARPASSGPSRTVGGRTQRMPVMTPQVLAEEVARMAGGAAPSPALNASPSNTPPAVAAGREFLRARDAARPDQDPGRRRIIAGIVVMAVTILVLFVVAMIPRCNQGQLEAQNLAATGAPGALPLPAENPSPPPAPIPTEIAAAATVDPPATAAPEPSAPPPEPVIPTAEPIAVAPSKKKAPVRPPPPRTTAQSTAGPAEKPPTPPPTPPPTTTAPPDDFILRPKEP